MSIRIDDLTVTFKNGVTAVDHVDLEIPHGIFGLLGENGAGKTTLMRMLCAILESTSGEVLLNGKEITSLGADYRNVLGYLPQDFGYYPNYTAMEFLMYVAALKGIPKDMAKKRANELLEVVGLSNVANKKVKTFSGGMKQRVGIAQALLNNPGILILDEPTAGLDPKGRDEILGQISHLQKETGISVVLVSHSMEDVANYVERIIVMNKGKVMFDDVPHRVFSHVKELEAVGLAAPQVTYILHQLKDNGFDVDPSATTIEEAKETILQAVRKNSK